MSVRWGGGEWAVAFLEKMKGRGKNRGRFILCQCDDDTKKKIVGVALGHGVTRARLLKSPR